MSQFYFDALWLCITLNIYSFIHRKDKEAAEALAASRAPVLPKKKKKQPKKDDLDDILNAGLSAGKKKK